MDIKYDNNKRHKEYVYSSLLYNVKPYDYEKNGLFNKILPPIFFKGNPFFVAFIQLLNTKCVAMLKNVDKVKRFKWITWY